MAKTLSRQRSRIIVALIKMWHDLYECDPSYLDFVCEADLSSHTVSRHLRALESHGELYIRRKRGLRNEYRINGGVG
jgi:DNA-binding MarR family transcriptional regulator